MLALSWLSVEDERGASADSDVIIVAYGDRCSKQRDHQDARNRKVIEALREILRERGVPEDQIGNPERSWQKRQTKRHRARRLGEFRDGWIRPRAIAGWEVVVRRWSRSDCTTEQDRITAVREAQAGRDEDEKFGDIQLFEALASDEPACVWRIDGKPDATPLKVYVAARYARERQVRFKVPAYRHPDALSHPVFCDFGTSRWDGRFAIHEREKASGAVNGFQAATLGGTKTRMACE